MIQRRGFRIRGRLIPEDTRLETHFKPLLRGILDGRVIPFFGAGVNTCHRPEAFQWTYRQRKYLPSGSELARHLSDTLGGPEVGAEDLIRTAQFAYLVSGDGPLYEELHKVFNADYPPTRVHRLFASLPGLLRKKGYEPQYLVHITTNYDDVLERSFQEANEPYDTLVYITEGGDRGKFVHISPDGTAQLIEKANEYTGVSPEKRSIILKIHGTVDRRDQDEGKAWSRESGRGDSFVITEDHYIDYLTRTDVSTLLPALVAAKLKKSHFLFLGYGLRDWNLRVILHRLAGSEPLRYASWAIQNKPDQLDVATFARRDVKIIEYDLKAYVDDLEKRLKGLPRK